MNSLAEGLGMSLPGCASIPGPYRERGQMAYATGLRIVDMVWEDLRPSHVMTKKAFENTIALASAIGASSNCPPHLIAIARHIGVDLDLADWQRVGADLPLLVDCQPAGRFLGEGFHRAGGVPAVQRELLGAGKLHGDVVTVSGKTLADNLAAIPSGDPDVIRPYGRPLMENAGFLVMTGNLFDSAVMKVSVISQAFRDRYLSDPAHPNVFEGKAAVFDGPEDYHARIDDPALDLDERTILFIRGCGTVGYPGSAEVVNMRPPAYLIKRGVGELPCIGDGRQSGTSASPSILNASPEAAVGGGLALLRMGDRVRIDLNTRRVDMLVADEELARRRAETPKTPHPPHQTPWQEMYRNSVGQLSTGGCIDFAVGYQQVAHKFTPRHSH
jgi:dihydroxy-acid dehydratase